MYDNDKPNPNSLGVVISFSPRITAITNLNTSRNTNKQQNININKKMYLSIIHLFSQIYTKNMKKTTIYYYKGVFMKISEKDIKKMVKESVIRVLSETNKIRPWKGDRKQIDPDWGEERQNMKDYAAQYGEKMNRRSLADQYGNVGGLGKQVINRYQKELTQKAQEKAIGETGSKYIGFDELKKTNIPIELIRNKLSENGFEIGIVGKTFSFGNSKLPPSTMIINITSARNCPSMKNCKVKNKLGNCYGQEIYPDVLLRNMRNEFTLPYLSGNDILKLLELYIENAPIKIHDIRISEDGDFRNQGEVNFCDKIAGHLKAKYGISTTVYTNAITLDFSGVKNMIINASSKAIRGATRYFIATPESVMANIPATNEVSYRIDARGKREPFFRCCGDCYICRFCYNTREENGETDPEPTTVYETYREKGSEVK